MAVRDFRELISRKWDGGRFLSVTLDPDLEKIPRIAKANDVAETIHNFNSAIVDATKDLVCAYKINSAFYEAQGEIGWRALQSSIDYIRASAPEIPIILDAKRADIGNSNNGYVRAFFDTLHADAVTVHPYLGAEALQPFLELKHKGIIVLCRTSNPGAQEFQDLLVNGEPLYMRVARQVHAAWNKNGNCGLVVGATYPEEMKKIREVADDVPFLIPGIGAQGGDIEKTVQNGKDSRGAGIIIVVGRSILFASNGEDFAEAAREKTKELHGAIQKAL